MRKTTNACRIFTENLLENGHLEDQEEGERITLRWVIKK
jgi:hypothetical protein